MPTTNPNKDAVVNTPPPPKPQHAAQMERERRQLADAVKRQEAERQRRLKEDAQALARKQQEINQRLEEAKRMQELADQERAAAKARIEEQMVWMGSVVVLCVCVRARVCVCVCDCV